MMCRQISLAILLSALAPFVRAGEVVRDISVTPQSDLSELPKFVVAARLDAKDKMVRVTFSAGDYRVRRTIDFGTNDGNVIMRAAPGARVRLIGGERLLSADFTEVTDAELLAKLPPERTACVYRADVSRLLPDKLAEDGDIVRGTPAPPHLYVNGKLQRTAQWPNEGWTTFSKSFSKDDEPGVFVYEDPRAGRWDFSHGVTMNGYWKHDWDNETRRAVAWEMRGTNRVIRLAKKGIYGTGGDTWGLNERRFRVVDQLSELDAPGEWHLDREKKMLYVVPPEGKFSVNDEIFLAVESVPLVRVRVSNVAFENIAFAYSGGDGVDAKGDGIAFLGCTFAALGGTALRLNGNANCAKNCDMTEIGCSGIELSGGDRKTLTRANSTVEDCRISRFGRFQRCYAGACNMTGCGLAVCGNMFRAAPHMAMRYETNECLIESNEICYVCLETNDAGAIYTGRDWTTAGNVLRGNFIHHLGNPASANGTGVMGIYFDDCDCGDEVVGNVFWKVPRGIMVGGGREHPIRNNVFRECALGYSIDNRGMTWKHWNTKGGGWHLEGMAEALRYKEDPWKGRYPWLSNIMNEEPQEPKNVPVEENVFIDCKKVCNLPGNDAKGMKAFSNLVMRANVVIRTKGAAGGCALPDERAANGFRVIDGAAAAAEFGNIDQLGKKKP